MHACKLTFALAVKVAGAQEVLLQQNKGQSECNGTTQASVSNHALVLGDTSSSGLAMPKLSSIYLIQV